jgi:hypothetical protein
MRSDNYSIQFGCDKALASRKGFIYQDIWCMASRELRERNKEFFSFSISCFYHLTGRAITAYIFAGVLYTPSYCFI